MSDTYFTAAPDWTWFIIPYFFVGGLAGGAYFLAAILEWFGRPDDRPAIRTGYYVAVIGAIASGLLLTFDLGRPERFWHMLFQSENFPRLIFKPWSPISFGAWGLLVFGLFSALSALGALSEEDRVRMPAARVFRGGTGVARLVAAGGGLAGFFLAGYTGVLLSVTNRPIWADSPWLGALFLVSGASTGAAILLLLAPRRGLAEASIGWLSTFDRNALVLELVVLVLFVVSLGSVARAFANGWGVLLVLGVVAAGIVWPLRLHARGASARPTAAWLVLMGGFLLRVVTLLASEGIELRRIAAGGAQ